LLHDGDPALSLPEAIILKNVLKTRLLATFSDRGAAIVVVGYLFNAILLNERNES